MKIRVFLLKVCYMDAKIAIQGSFHHQVAQEYYEHSVVVDECLSFEELVNSLLSGRD
jgi:prephenate dehydratase